MGGKAMTSTACHCHGENTHPGSLQATTWDNWSWSWEEVWMISSPAVVEAGGSTQLWDHGREVYTAEEPGTRVNWDLSILWPCLQLAWASIPGKTKYNTTILTLIIESKIILSLISGGIRLDLRNRWFFCFVLFLSIVDLGFPGGSAVKNPPTMQEMWVQSLHWVDPPGGGMATHSSILA